MLQLHSFFVVETMINVLLLLDGCLIVITMLNPHCWYRFHVDKLVIGSEIDFNFRIVS